MSPQEHLPQVVAGYLEEYGLQLVTNYVLGLFLINELDVLLMQIL
jgi:hypothetical protein